MRQIKITNEKLYKILGDKEVLINEGRQISKDIEERETSRAKIGLKVEKLKEKAVKCVEKEAFKLEEFEYLQSIDAKDGEVVVTIQDKLEEVKEAIREQKKENKENSK
jgi:hypothetical protein